MTNFAIICLSAAVGFVALGGIFSVSLFRAAAKPVPTPKPKRRFVRDTCPYCSERDVKLDKNGEPVWHWHRRCGGRPLGHEPPQILPRQSGDRPERLA